MAASSAANRPRCSEHVVVDLRAPATARRARARRAGSAAAVDRGHRDLVAHDVVGVRVAAVLVVGGQHVRTELADHLHQRPGGLVRVEQREAALRQRRQRVALGQPGVDEAEPDLLDAEDLARPAPSRRGAARRGSPGSRGVSIFGLRIDAALAAGAGGHHHLDALGHVVRGGRRALARLVVGVGVDVQEPQGFMPLILDNSAARASNPRRWRMDAVTDDAAARLARRYPQRRHRALVDPAWPSSLAAAGAVVAGLGRQLRRHRDGHRTGGRVRGALRHRDRRHRHDRPSRPVRRRGVPALSRRPSPTTGSARPGCGSSRAARA